MEYRIADRIRPLPLSNVKLTGPIGELAARLIDRRIASDYAKNVVYRETIDAYRNRIDDADAQRLGADHRRRRIGGAVEKRAALLGVGV